MVNIKYVNHIIFLFFNKNKTQKYSQIFEQSGTSNVLFCKEYQNISINRKMI